MVNDRATFRALICYCMLWWQWPTMIVCTCMVLGLHMYMYICIYLCCTVFCKLCLHVILKVRWYMYMYVMYSYPPNLYTTAYICRYSNKPCSVLHSTWSCSNWAHLLPDTCMWDVPPPPTHATPVLCHRFIFTVVVDGGVSGITCSKS